MDIKVISDTKKPLLGLSEIKFSIIADAATPSKQEVHKQLCKQLNLHPENTVITGMRQNFGTRIIEGVAHSYHDAQALNKHEPKHLLARIAKKKAASQKDAEAPAQPAEEQPQAAAT